MHKYLLLHFHPKKLKLVVHNPQNSFSTQGNCTKATNTKCEKGTKKLSNLYLPKQCCLSTKINNMNPVKEQNYFNLLCENSSLPFSQTYCLRRKNGSKRNLNYRYGPSKHSASTNSFNYRKYTQ